MSNWIEKRYKKYKMNKRHKDGEFKEIKLSYVVAKELTKTSRKTVKNKQRIRNDNCRNR
jgi:hypothetical protein